MVVIGGGPVGVTLAEWTRAAGLSVALAESELIGGECEYRACVLGWTASSVKWSLSISPKAGVDVRTGVSVIGLSRPHGTVPVTLQQDGGGEVEADEVLFATGRAPQTHDIGLETVGLTPGSWLVVEEPCRVRALDDGWLYAIGDVNHHAPLTHQGKYQARIRGAAIAARAAGRPLDTVPWGAHATTADHYAVPQVLFCDPEATAVWLTAEQAERAGHRVRAVDVDLGPVEGALEYADGCPGRARVVVDLDYRLGVIFVGPGVAKLLHSVTVAVAGEIPADRFWHAVPCFPSISEVWLRLLEAYRGLRERLVAAVRVSVLGGAAILAIGLADHFTGWLLLTSTLGPTAYLLCVHRRHPWSRWRNAVAGHSVGLGAGLASLWLTANRQVGDETPRRLRAKLGDRKL